MQHTFKNGTPNDQPAFATFGHSQPVSLKQQLRDMNDLGFRSLHCGYNSA
jgi:hypothetical protein